MENVRRIPRAERAQKDVPGADLSDTIPRELADAIRAFMAKEWQRLRRDELFYLRRGMRAELTDIEKELGMNPE